MYKKIKGGWSKHFDFMIIDLFALNVAFYLSYFLRFGLNNPAEHPIYKNFLLEIIVLHILLVFFSEPYSGILRRGKLQELKYSISYITKFMAIYLIYTFFIKRTQEYSRLSCTYFCIFGMITITLARILFKKCIGTWSKAPRKSQYLVIITTYHTASQIIKKFQENNTFSEMQLAGLIITDQDAVGDCIDGVNVVASKDTLLEYIHKNVVDRVLFNDMTPLVTDIVYQLVSIGVIVHLNVDFAYSQLPNCTVEAVGGFNVVSTSISVASDRQLFIKRAFDILFGLLGILLCGVLCLFLAPIIKLQSPGPVFFSQVRVGKNGRKFRLYKFRSMYIDAEERKKELIEQNEMQGPMFKMNNDPRIFPAGRFLRKYSIDELPQFWNVFKGEMSLVGTRPPTEAEYELYKIEHKSRLAAKPGITGMWQVSGRSDITDFDEVVELDNEYVRNWRLALDIKIILKTVPAVLCGSGAK